MKLKRTHEEFIKTLDGVHPNRDWQVIGGYEHNMVPILLRDKYGDCLIKPNALVQRSSPSVKTAIDKTSYTINKFIETWGKDMFDYSEFVYKGARVKSTLICKAKGHRFLSDANNHLSKRGCPQCANSLISDRVRSNTKEFIKKAVKKYGAEDYSFKKTNYITTTQDVVITCKKHGDFNQTPNRFLNGQICPRCNYKENSTNFHNRKKKVNKSILYIIECYNEKERFIKIGVTTRSIKNRFKDNYDMPYNYNVLREFQYANIDAPHTLETQLLSFTKSLRYIPKISFSGRTETRCLSIKKPLLELFDSYRDNLYYLAFVNFAKAYEWVLDLDVLNSGNYSKLEIESVMKGYEIHKKLN